MRVNLARRAEIGSAKRARTRAAILDRGARMLRSRPGHEISRRGAIEERRNEARRNEGKRCEQPDVPFPSAFALGNLGH